MHSNKIRQIANKCQKINAISEILDGMVYSGVYSYHIIFTIKNLGFAFSFFASGH